MLIGEMRDLETIEAAMTLAETGHLALGTLHTNNAIQSINRIVDAFPSSAQGQIRSVLSFVLEGVVTQTLIPKANGTGRMLASEVLVPNAAIRNLIREDKLHQIYSQMQIGQSIGRCGCANGHRVAAVSRVSGGTRFRRQKPDRIFRNRGASA